MTTLVSNRIDGLFERCRRENRAALVLYITSGFPHAETTSKLLPILADAGCDLIELGVPFSDPIADGPTIQRASTISLERGMTLPQTLDILKGFRKVSDVPVVLFGALNPFLIRGLEHAAEMSAEAGADGVLAADLPLEESAEFRPHLQAAGLHLINLVAPTTPNDRVRQIAEQSSGFLYCIALKGVTGARKDLASDAKGYVARLRGQTTLPLALGFGISRPEHVRAAVDAGADAVVVGSALIDAIEKAVSSGADLEKEIGGYVRSLAAELKRT